MVNLIFWKFPFSLIMMLLYLLAVALTYVLLSRKDLVKSFTGPYSSTFFLTILSLLLAIEGTWKINLQHSWSFVIIALAMNMTLGIAVIDGIRKKLGWTFVLSHLGLFMISVAWCFGAPDFSELRIVAAKEEATSVGISGDGKMRELPFSVKLDEFHIDYYDNGASPKQYTSVLDIEGTQVTTSVNHPGKYEGHYIYQSDYDKDEGRYTVLKLVRDDSIPFIFLGIIVLAAGSLFQLRKTWHSKAVLPLIIALAVIFGAISLAKINFGTLVPALRSLWFVPHIIIYMLAYSVLALSLISGCVGLSAKPNFTILSGKLLSSASCLLLLGMSCGAVWAKYAWGDFWTWDGKECWAAVTWLLTLIATHIPAKNRKLVLTFIIIAFAAMQITWYGVDYLPSSSFSLHTYK